MFWFEPPPVNPTLQRKKERERMARKRAEATRKYLDGEITYERLAKAFQTFLAMPPELGVEEAEEERGVVVQFRARG